MTWLEEYAVTSDFLAKAESLRKEAWNAVLASKEYSIFKAMNAAVVAAGGHPSFDYETKGPAPASRGHGASDWLKEVNSAQIAHSAGAVGRHSSARRLSQGDAAELALIRSEEPQTAVNLLHRATTEGAVIGGERPLVNFTSSLSKDTRFYSFRKNGAYFWWLCDVALPPEWNETEPDEFEGLLGSASSVHSSQEGGDGDAPATS